MDSDFPRAIRQSPTWMESVLEGGRRFSPWPPFLTSGRAFFGSAKDVDGDGQLDLMIANGATDDVAVLFGLRDYLRAAAAERWNWPESDAARVDGAAPEGRR